MGAPAVAPRRAPAPARAPARAPRPRPKRRPAGRSPRRAGAKPAPKRPNSALASGRRVAAPRRPPLAQPALAGAAQAAVSAAGAVRDISDSSLIVRLTRGRGWIALLCALLGGIVTLNVLSLSITTGSGQISQQIAQLERSNSALRGELAEQLSASRVEAWAADAGLAVPHPRDIGYLAPAASDFDRFLAGLEEGTLLSGPDPAPTEVVEDPAYVPTAPTEVPAPESETAAPVPAAPEATAPAPTESGASGGVGL